MANILIIDDDLMLSRLLKEHLTNEGFDVDTASMAEEGVEKAVQNLPDLIMLDVQLPDATGFQICGRLRQDARTHAIPIMMMTGTARSQNQKAIAKDIMGATDYLLKPFDVVSVGKKVQRLLKANPPQPKITPAVPVPEPVVLEAPAVTLPPDTPIFSSDPVMLSSPRLEPVPFIQEIDRNAAAVAVQAPPAEPEAAPQEVQTHSFVEAGTPIEQTGDPVEQEPAFFPAVEEMTPHETIRIKDRPFDFPALNHMEPPPLPEETRPLPILETPSLLPSRLLNGAYAANPSQPIVLTAAMQKLEPSGDFSAAPAVIDAMSQDPVLNIVHPVAAASARPADDAAPKPLSEPIPTLTHVSPTLSSGVPGAYTLSAGNTGIPSLLWMMVGAHILFSASLTLALPDDKPGIMQTVSHVTGGWILFFGLLMAVAAAFHVQLQPKRAFRMMVLAGWPIVLRALCAAIGALIPSFTSFSAMALAKPIPQSVLLLRPLDLFETASMLILALLLHRQKNLSIVKATGITAIIAMVWVVTSRGYFHPF